MPTRAQLEESLGKRWAALARREGHTASLPNNSRPVGKHMQMEAKAQTLLRAMERQPRVTLKALASDLSTTTEDVSRRMMFLMRAGRVRLVNQAYEVVE